MTKHKQRQPYRPRRQFGDLIGLLLPLIAMSDFEKLEKENADKIYQTMPAFFRRAYEGKDRELLGMYKIAGDKTSMMYFMHSYNHDDKACSCALIVDFSHDERMPQEGRKWMCLNPRSQEVALALEICSSLVHADDDEDHSSHDVEYV